MAKKLMNLTVPTSDGPYNFRVLADPAYLDHWRSVGLDIETVRNTVPDWVPSRLIKAWTFAQDVFNFRNPWSKS